MSSAADNTGKESLEDQASLLSTVFLFYLNPLFTKGANATDSSNQVELVDLGPTSKQDRASKLYTEFTKQWEKERLLKPKHRSLWFVLWRTVGYHKLFKAIFLYSLYSASSFGPVLILNALVKHFQGTNKLSTPLLWVLVVLIFVIPMIGSIFSAHSSVELAHVGVQFRNAMVTAIYRKSLRLSPAARQKSSTGQIVNMFSNDTAQLQRFMYFLNNMVVAIPMIIVCLFLIYLQVGVATFVGLALIIVTIPLNGMVFGWLGSVRRQKVLETDKRVKMMNEVLNGIRIIKFYAWEAAFSQRIEALRWVELKLIRKIAYIIAIAFSLVLMAVPTFMPVLIFYTYVKLGNQLDAAKAFTAIALFNLMQFPFLFLPLGLTQYSQSRVSTARMLTFLDLEELAPYVDHSLGPDDVAVEMKEVSMGWVEPTATGAGKGGTPQVVVQGGAKGGAKVVVDAVEKEGAPNVARPGNGASTAYAAVSTHDTADTPAATPTKEVSNEVELTPTTAAATDDDPSGINRSVHTLRNVSFSIKRGELVAVVGSVGSGKTSLLNGLLGEMLLTQGSVRVHGSVAYCDQRPWVLNDTVQGNVLFGKAYDEERFDRALYAASLEEDVAVLPGGINTQIGERGINLSGGQKARVALARAIYCDADVYLLDDPLSAVDAHVGQFLFHEGIRSCLAGKTRILVTHQVHLLPYFDKIIVMDAGQVKACGSYDELTRSGVDIEAFVPAHTGSSTATAAAAGVTEDNAVPSAPGSAHGSPQVSAGAETGAISSHLARKAVDAEPTAAAGQNAASDAEERPLTPSANAAEYYKEHRARSLRLATQRRTDSRATTLNSVEERNQGDVTWAIYLYYMKAGGVGIFTMMCFFVVFAQTAQVLSSYWLSYWGEESVDHEQDGRPLSNNRNVWYLNIYAALACVNLFFYIMRSCALANHRLGASLDLHRGILKATLAAPVAFFDVTPIGRILNRFSSDLLTVDEEISQSVSQGMNSISSVLAAVGAIAGATKGTFLVLLLPIMVFYRLIQGFFKATNTSVARLESISRSPIYADFSQALNGMTSIRAYDCAPRFIARLEGYVDTNTVANVTQQLTAQWLAIRLDFIGALISFFMAVLAAAAPGFVPPGFLALGLSYSFQLTTYVKHMVRMVATLDAQLNSVERVKYYMDHIEAEGAGLKDQEMDGSEIPTSWPDEGRVVGHDVALRYRNGPLVLKGLSFDITGAEKVGVAGRTGSGKSSLIIALFRIQELAKGSITIDNIDISKVPLTLLRSKLGIIPQDPVMFSATVRFNLDPFDAHTDTEIWQVLESINMADHIKSLPKRLQEEVSEGGDNFSAGQRQLICIARAILRKPKILVLDEATASIDNETDALVQRMVREQFKECTVLTIAHRLNTIIDSDKIMVMDDGLLAEFDSPQKLLAVPQGLFHALWDKHVQSHGQE